MPETEVAEQTEQTEEEKQKPYWYVDFVKFEEKESRANRLILGLRKKDGNETRRAQVFVNQKIKIPTWAIHRTEKEQLADIAQSWRESTELKKHELSVFLSEFDANVPARVESLRNRYPGINIKYNWGGFNVFQLEAPNDPNLIGRLNHNFQAGNYNRNFRFDHDLLHRKVSFDPQFEERLVSGETDIVLNSLDEIKFTDSRITEEDFRSQVWFYADIEKPLFKYQGETRAGVKRDNEKLNLDRRERLLLLKEVKRNYRKKLDDLVAGGKSREEVNEQIGRIVGKLERKLTKNIAGYEVKLWEEKYDAKISWYTFTLKKADGTYIRELHTLHDCGLDEINGCKIVRHATEKDLLDTVIGIMKKNNVSVFANHNLPYDVTQTRFASERVGADTVDIAVDGVNARRDFSKEICQRMGHDITYIDTLRLATVAFPWLENHKLETVAQHLLGEGVFKKSLNYDQMRELEVMAINGDKEAARLMADYSTSDVAPVRRIVEENDFLRTIFKIRDMYPFLTLTKIAFGPNCMKEVHAQRHWQQHHNNIHYGYESKIRNDQEQIFKKRFEPLKREWMRDWGPQVHNVSGRQGEVTQVYLPIEEWLKDIVCTIDRKWEGYYQNLSTDSLQRFYELRYPREFLKEVLADQYFAVNEEKKHKRRIKVLNMEKSELSGFLDILKQNTDGELKDKLVGSLKYLRNHYRTIHERLPADSRGQIRTRKKFSGDTNLLLGFVSFFEEDNNDLIMLRKNAASLSRKLDSSGKRELNRYLSKFQTFDSAVAQIGESARAIPDKISPENLVYLYALDDVFKGREKKFKFDYSIDFRIIDDALKRSYSALASELKAKNAQVVGYNGDYLFLKGNVDSYADLKTVVPIRTIRDYHVNSREQDASEGQQSLGI